MSPEFPSTLAGAFGAGLLASIHCAAMCGPLACAACQVKGNCSSSTAPAAWYQAGRLFSYTTIGGLAGAFGATLLALRSGHWLIWIGAAAVLACVFILAHAGGTRFRHRHGPLLIGLLTAGLPCAPLYLMFAVCAISGSPARGAGLALSFGLGTVPLLYLAQQQWGRLQRFSVNQPFARVLHTGLVALVFGVVLWRVYAGSLNPASCCSVPHLP